MARSAATSANVWSWPAKRPLSPKSAPEEDRKINRTALQLCPLLPFLEKGLADRLEVVRWFELSQSQQSALLQGRADEVVAVVTSGHLGCPTSLMEALPSLGVIAINGVGFDKVDLEAARQRKVHVTTTPGTLTEDVADLAVGLIIALLRQIPASDAHVRASAWPTAERPLARKVSGRRFGILGLGQIGGAIAARLTAFGPVAYTARAPKQVAYDFHASAVALAGASDVLVVACSANETTRHMVDEAVLEALGPDGWLVNVSRGSVVHEAALIEALEAGRIAGAGLDVFEDEPFVPEALRASAKVVLTPHVASATEEARRTMAELVLNNLDAFLRGDRPPSAVV
jgi:lactate dehydrogenase-like 2-hydroxyacid dehydrogenase